MHIKQIILEGFKSYASRTIIDGFDPQFNAITGLNGSGKSNILDGILFVLGLTQLGMARVNTLNELIYKFGHAGVTKASVTIIFDNTNKKQSPVGYEEFDTIIVTRQISQQKSKYFLNGHNESNSRIKNLFKSVQLNIDTPHFLVAQGKITKIINLKPQDLSGMLEETAGTSLYNDKRKETQKIIEKKEQKLGEIQDLLEKEIQPQMTKLEKEKNDYLVWKSGENQLQILIKVLRAYEYFTSLSSQHERQNELEELKRNEIESEARKASLAKTKETFEQQLKIFRQQEDEKKAKTELDEKYNQEKKNIVKYESEINNLQKTIENLNQEIEEKQNSLLDFTTSIPRFEQKMAFVKNAIQQTELYYAQKKAAQDEIFKNIEDEKQGKKIGDQAIDIVNQQLTEVQSRLSQTLSQIEQLNQKRIHLSRELKNQQEVMSQQNKEKNNDQEKLKILNREILDLETEINRSNFSEYELHNENEQKRKLEEQSVNIQHELNQILQNNWTFRLTYRDPEPNFARWKVKGRLFTLFTPKNNQFIKALEAAAGGKLQNIVVEDEMTAKSLMKNHCFQGYVNLIPKTKIRGFEIPEDIVKQAEQIAKQMNGNASPAYQLINYSDASLKNTMLYAFGQTFICSSNEIAKAICFQFRKRCVNLDGDIFNSQTLTGGYISAQASVLTRYSKYKEKEKEFNEIQQQIKLKTQTVIQKQKEADELVQLKGEMENKINSLNSIKDKVRKHSNLKLQERNQIMSNEINDIQEQLDQLAEIKKNVENEKLNLQEEKSQLGNMQSGDQKKVLQEKANKLKLETSEAQNKLKDQKDQLYTYEVYNLFNKFYQKQQVEIEQAGEQIKILNKKLKDHNEQLIKNDSLLSSKQVELSRIKKDFQIIESEKLELEKTLESKNTQIQELERNLKDVKGKLENQEKECRQIINQINHINKELKEIDEKIMQLEKTYSFIMQDREMFAQRGTEYDFTEFNYEQSQKQYTALKAEQDILKKKVNLKVEVMYEKVEKQYKNLIEKRTIVQQDKMTLQENMDQLDEKKKDALKRCYMVVNQNFGKIFSTLLPGTDAKIQTFAGKEVSEGLEISVAFNKIWKNSLSELSGGQRSLLALSFMLSLLLFKPAPFYILDEIDAALDLSHTENIGAMISQHFPQSQFLIISLKDGMYNNANVLFKTSFIDGVSKIDKIVLKKTEKRKKLEEIMKKQIISVSNQINSEI